ncbi:ABC transporter ATP-binding protein [Vallitalea pronyensis]|uniref:ABC transporter ATP-binding protein n=1 Tax=Vallitalea pronyensis TaxID=1348613 RepID=A0A8J8MMR7_9FIRM|nr:ABC transporter ATP-binding protein [Vallitalea pronyensis]QUI24540.1 ABC transporter ATP-binding protein [Vallitalea pronyensis]
MSKLVVVLWQKRTLLIALFTLCISRGILVLWLNKGYAELIDNILKGSYDLINNTAMLIVCAGIVQVVVLVTQSLISSKLAEKTGYALRTDAIDGILKSNYVTVNHLSTGGSLSKLNTDLSGIIEWIKNELSPLLSDSLLMIIVLTALLMMNWKLTVVSFFPVPFISIGAYLLSKPITSIEKKKNQTLSDVNVIAKSIVDAFSILKIFQMTHNLLSKIDKKINLSIQSEIKANNIRAKLMSINGFLAYIPTSIMWGYGGYMVIKGNLSAGTLLAFTNMSSFVRNPLVNLPAKICSIRAFMANTSRLMDMLTQFKSVHHHGRIKQDMTKKNVIQFQNVSFGYSKETNSLQNISFKIYRNTNIAVVGESGCGKSTILKLISGLYHPDQGEILFFGDSIRHTQLDHVRSQISYIPQDAQLFPISIFENITCGHSISMDRVMDACKAAQLMDFLNTLPDGIYTNIGEHGSRLSGGERQRISIARAIAKNAPVFLMDEATSALDGETEEKVLNYFNGLKNEHTVIYVTHKIKHAVNADLILCMKNGQLCESGTHDDLLQSNGYYSKLFMLQNMQEVIAHEKDSKAI